MDLDAYRASAERFVVTLGREYYQHFAGLKESFEVESIYDAHAELFTRAAVEQLRELAGRPLHGDDRRPMRRLLQFCVEGHLGQANKAIEAALAQREVGLEIEVDGERIGFRASSVAQANEPDRERRARIETARLQATAEQLNPLHREALEQVHSLTRALGWPSYRALCEQLTGIDLAALERQTAAFIEATENHYGEVLDPELRRGIGIGLAELRRSDLPWFFRSADADALFPAERLVSSLRETLAGLGIDLEAQANVTLDVEPRSKKSPRAFCSPVRVPGEIYLVVPPVGGRDDYFALFHEGGHAEHFAWVDPQLPFEFRHLGDNSVTEGFAFLFDHLIEDPVWLRTRLGVDDHDGLAGRVRAQRLVFIRRYAAKLTYELELHGSERPPDAELAELYARLLSAAVRVPWPSTTYLVDVDPGFYVANYLRAWALETHLRATLSERFGSAWFTEPAAGELLKSLWRQGQRLDADELLGELTGAELDFSAMLADLDLAG